MRGDAVDAGEVEHMAQLPAHVVRRQRRPLSTAEQQGVERGALPPCQPTPHRFCGERWDRDRAPGLRRLRVILPLHRLAALSDDGAVDADRRNGARHVDVAPPDREHLADARGRAEHDFDYRTELPVGLRTRW